MYVDMSNINLLFQFGILDCINLGSGSLGYRCLFATSALVRLEVKLNKEAQKGKVDASATLNGAPRLVVSSSRSILNKWDGN